MIGEPLQAKFARHRFTEAELVGVARQALTTLADLHGRKPPMFHGAITPENLQQVPDGTIVIVGAGKAGVDAASDLFGLGTTLHFLGTKTKMSRGFAMFVRTLTATDPAQRFPTAAAALAALAALPTRRHLARKWLLAALGLGALLGGGGAYVGWRITHPASAAAKMEVIRLPDRMVPRPPGLVAPNRRQHLGGAGNSN
jgi:hypothetical protein